MVLTLGQLIGLWGNPITSDPLNLNLSRPIGHVCTDSRKFVEGCFYVPLQGEQFDGHNFLKQVFKLGAQAAVVSRTTKHEVPSGLLHWIVDDTLHAYQQLGLMHRCDLSIPVIAVTGSTGKTTTRELIKAMLKPLGDVVASTDNNNNDVGVPLTLLTADASNCALVVEMGMRAMGEIERLSKYSEPDIAVITNIGSAHIGRLGSRQNIAKAKCEITSSLRPSGLVVIPAGDSLLEKELSSMWSGRVVRVGLDDSLLELSSDDALSFSSSSPRCDILGIHLLSQGLLLVDGIKYQLPLEGRHNALNFLLALAVARELGVKVPANKKMDVTIPSGRHRFITIDQITFIDETYNSSPEAVHASLDLLITKPGRHFAVLGTMLELGEQSVALHRQIADHAVKLGLDGLVIVANGEEADSMARAASSIRYLSVVATPEEAFDPLSAWLEPGDIVLLKASRGVALERLIPLLIGDLS